jgi:membrane-bound metal-dependent hydrolase YbcI (DUF457 family)
MNRATHQWAGAVAGLLAVTTDRNDACSPLHHPMAAMVLGSIAGTLPDMIEPAIGNPHHRQFFHSVTIGTALVWGASRVYQWQPESDAEKVVRVALLVGGAAYLSHLLLDSSTPRSLPLLGHL